MTHNSTLTKSISLYAETLAAQTFNFTVKDRFNTEVAAVELLTLLNPVPFGAESGSFD